MSHEILSVRSGPYYGKNEDNHVFCDKSMALDINNFQGLLNYMNNGYNGT